MSAGNEEILDRDQAMIWKPLFAGGLLLALCACVSLPEGPSLPAYPGTKKTFDQFSADDAACRQYALASVGGKTAQQSVRLPGRWPAGAKAPASAQGRVWLSAARWAQALPSSRGTVLNNATTWLTTSACMPKARRFRSQAASCRPGVRSTLLHTLGPLPTRIRTEDQDQGRDQ